MATGFEQFKRLRLDGVESYLATALGSGDPTMELTGPLKHDGGHAVPTFGSDEYLVLSILDANYVLKEIVYLTEYREGDSAALKISRGMEFTGPGDHSKGNKVVHSATAEDFLSVLMHNQDPDAHGDMMEDIARGIAQAIMDAHLAHLNPHPQYALLKSLDGSPIIFDNDVVFNKNVTVKGVLLIPKGATLRIEGTLEVETPVTNVIDGIISIHDKRLVISNTEPSSMVDTVWIQTFGA